MFQFKNGDIIDVDLLGVRKRKVICPSERECKFIKHCLQFLQGDSSKSFPEDSTTMFYFKSLKNNRLAVRFYIGKENKITEQAGGSKEERLIYNSDKFINFESTLFKSFFSDDFDSEELLKREDSWKSIIQYFYKFMVDNDYLEKMILLDPRKPVDENYKREDNPIHSKEIIDRVNEVLYACDLKYEKIGYNLECLHINSDDTTESFSYDRCGSGFQVIANILPYLCGIKDKPNNTLFITSATFNSIHFLLRQRLVRDIMLNLKGKVILSEYYETDDIMKLYREQISKGQEPIYITEEYRNTDENPGKYL